MQHAASPPLSAAPLRADLDTRTLVGFLALSESYLLHSRIVIDDRGRPCVEPCDDDSFAERREAFVRYGALRAAAVHLMCTGASRAAVALR